ncbi:MAG: galactose oxidase-like domain-containing protein [Myxococcota bacterium]
MTVVESYAVRSIRSGIVVCLFAVAAVGARPVAAQGPEVVGQWSPVIAWPHIPVSAANLPDGRIVTWSASRETAFPNNGEFFTHSAVYDPASDTFVTTNNPHNDIFCAGISLTEDGSVMVTGGRQVNRRTGAFDPQTLLWSRRSDMGFPRWYGSQLTLPNDEVVAVFAQGAGPVVERYSEPVDRWIALPGMEMNTAAAEQGATNSGGANNGGTNSQWWSFLHVAPDGRVFQSGPWPTMHWYDAEGSGDIEAAGTRLDADQTRAFGTSTMYDVGKVLVVGGQDRKAPEASSREAIRMDISGAAPVVSRAADMAFKRTNHDAIVLPDGNVIVIGGNENAKLFNDQTSVFEPEIWDPASDQWTRMAPHVVPRNYHSVGLLMKDGRVLSGGGGLCGNCPENHQDAEIFSPPYLFGPGGAPAVRPTISSSPGTVRAGESHAVTATPGISAFNMIRLAGVTHSTNTDSRFVPVSFSEDAPGEYTVFLEDNPNVLVQGYYWLFAVDASGVPSIGETIQVLRDTQPSDSPVAYEVFHGSWSALPDMDALTPETSGNTDDFTLEVRLRENDYALRFRTRFFVATDGDYSFATLSDDGSKLWIDETEVVDNDGAHGLQRADGTISLTAGYHDVELQYFNAGGAGQLAVRWSGPGFVETSFDGRDVGDVQIPIAFVEAVETQPGPIDSTITWSALAQGAGEVDYDWSFGDGNSVTTTSASVSHTYTQPGRYTVVVLASDKAGQQVSQQFVQVVHAASFLAEAPRHSSTVALDDSQGGDLIWNVNPDQDTFTVIDGDGNVITEQPTGANPWAVAHNPDAAEAWIVNKQSATVSIYDAALFVLIDTVTLPRASRPHGIVFADGAAFVALEASGQVWRIDGDLVTPIDVGPRPKHLSIDPQSGKLLVSHFVTPPLPGEAGIAPVVDQDGQSYGAWVTPIDAATLTVGPPIVLGHNDSAPTEHSGPGIPNYLGPAVIAPTGTMAYVPSKQDNVLGGVMRSGEDLRFDQTVRAVSSHIDLTTLSENRSARVEHDDASVATDSTFGPYGVHLFTLLEGNRQVVVNDAALGTELGRIQVGRAPQGIVRSSSNRLYVHNFMDRTMTIIDVDALVRGGAMTSVSEVALADSTSNELLDPEVLVGKQLFYDASDDRLAAFDYMSCASCHKEGEQDGRVWDFAGAGEGLRNTISLVGRGGPEHGMIHWTGNFDELQDFEGQIRSFGGGTGLMDDAHFFEGSRSEPLGDQKTGFSADLDALAAYMESLTTVRQSPFRLAGWSDTRASRGRSEFVLAGCNSCHSGDALTDSATGARHDVGTLSESSGDRLGDTLDGLDTPSLQGVWATPPYLHDGSAATLEDAITRHESAEALSEESVEEIAYYLRTVENRANPASACAAAGNPASGLPLGSIMMVVFAGLVARRSSRRGRRNVAQS